MWWCALGRDLDSTDKEEAVIKNNVELLQNNHTDNNQNQNQKLKNKELQKYKLSREKLQKDIKTIRMLKHEEYTKSEPNCLQFNQCNGKSCVECQKVFNKLNRKPIIRPHGLPLQSRK